MSISLVFVLSSAANACLLSANENQHISNHFNINPEGVTGIARGKSEKFARLLRSVIKETWAISNFG